MAINVLTINFRHDDSRTTQISHSATWLSIIHFENKS